MSATAPPLEVNRPMPTFTPIEGSRFQLFAGGRLLSKSLIYETKANTRSLTGGIRYETLWLPGWGIKLAFRPFSSPDGSPGRLALYGSFERYVFQSVRIVNSLFDSPERLYLPSDLNRWQAGFRYSYPLPTANRIHQIGLSVSYHGALMNIAPNSEFLGLDTHLTELGIFGEFTILPQHFYLELGGGFHPLASLGNRVEEFGASSENYGLAAWVGFRYRSQSGLTLSLMLHLDFLFSEPIGTGRDGRIGETARDQTISLDFDIGFSSSPIP